MSILYPEIDFSEQYNKYAFKSLDADMLAYLTSLWENLKIS